MTIPEKDMIDFGSFLLGWVIGVISLRLMNVAVRGRLNRLCVRR